MLAHLITIGNSKGLRFSRALLEQCGIKDEIELEVVNNEIRIKASSKRPREGWGAMFRNAYKMGKPEMLIDDNLDLDWEDWQ